MIETNGRNFGLLILGQVPLRLSPPDNKRLSKGDAFAKQVGGAGLSVAVGTVPLGLHTGVISKPPVHDIGSFMKGKIRSFGVNDDFFMYDQSFAVRVGICYYENGAYPRKPRVIYNCSHSFFLSLDTDETPGEVHMVSKCLHTTSIALTLNGDIRETIIEMIKRLKVTGALVSFDVNFQGNLQIGDQARGCVLRIPPHVDIFFCPEDTARLIFLKTGTVKEMMKSSTGGFPISIVASTQRTIRSPKRHTLGSVIYDATKDEYYEGEPHRNIEVVDRVGNGDTYMSGALHGLLSMGGGCVKTVALDNATAAVGNTIPGDLPSSNLEETQTIIRVHNQTGSQSGVAR